LRFRRLPEPRRRSTPIVAGMTSLRRYRGSMLQKSHVLALPGKKALTIAVRGAVPARRRRAFPACHAADVIPREADAWRLIVARIFFNATTRRRGGRVVEGAP